MELNVALLFFQAEAKKQLTIIGRFTDLTRLISVPGHEDVTGEIMTAVEKYDKAQSCADRIQHMITSSNVMMAQLKKKAEEEEEDTPPDSPPELAVE